MDLNVKEYGIIRNRNLREVKEIILIYCVLLDVKLPRDAR